MIRDNVSNLLSATSFRYITDLTQPITSHVSVFVFSSQPLAYFRLNHESRASVDPLGDTLEHKIVYPAFISTVS